MRENSEEHWSGWIWGKRSRRQAGVLGFIQLVSMAATLHFTHSTGWAVFFAFQAGINLQLCFEGREKVQEL